VEVAVTNGAPLLTLNNADAVLTIGNSYALDAPFPGSIALLKLSATVPTVEQELWMYEQEKHLFRDGAQCLLPDANAISDLTYDDATDKWIAVSSANESEWSGLVRTSTKAVPSGAYSKVSATSGVKMYGRTTTSPGVDIELPAYGLREQVLKRDQRQDEAMFDFLGGFTATTNITAGTSYNLTSVAASLYPVSYVGAVISGSGIPASLCGGRIGHHDLHERSGHDCCQCRADQLHRLHLACRLRGQDGLCGWRHEVRGCNTRLHPAF
jgi:hypothetical protein